MRDLRWGGAGAVMDAAGNWVSRTVRVPGGGAGAEATAAAQIPARYMDCTLDAFDPSYPGADPTLGRALQTARKFAETYPVDTAGRGLLFVGTAGLGKTHLAVGILRRLIQERGAPGLFCDYRELLKSIQNSYNPEVRTTELELLKPVFAAEVLVLDDLGAQKPNEWVWDTVALILNTRYNDRQTTIITTNYPDLPAGAGDEVRQKRRQGRDPRRHAGRPHRRPHEVAAGGDVRARGDEGRRLQAVGEAGEVRVREAAISQ